jgi:prephenate dehydrogenase
LALPVDQIQDTLKYISEDLKPGAVVINTSPIRAGVSDWVKTFIPAERHFVSMMPAINPIYLAEKSEDLDTPHADLFKNGEMILATGIDTHPDAVKLAADLATLLGSNLYFVDPLEADGISAKVELLPKLVAAALLNTTIGQPGWKDAQRFTSKAFHRSTAPIELLDENKQLGETAILNHENMTVALDQMILNLREIRALIAEKDQKSLTEYLKKGKDGRENWVEHRKTGDWEKYIGDKPPSSKQMLGGLFGIRPKNRKKE